MPGITMVVAEEGRGMAASTPRDTFMVGAAAAPLLARRAYAQAPFPTRPIRIGRVGKGACAYARRASSGAAAAPTINVSRGVEAAMPLPSSATTIVMPGMLGLFVAPGQGELGGGRQRGAHDA